jgi:hypothetical protein
MRAAPVSRSGGTIWSVPMGKRKQKSAVALPKRIGGVRLSKGLRRSLGALLQLADSPVGRQVFAAALAAAAASLMNGKGKDGGEDEGKRKAAKPASGSPDLGTWLGEAAATAIMIAARQLHPARDQAEEAEKPNKRDASATAAGQQPQSLHG